MEILSKPKMGKSREASSKNIQLAFFPNVEENLNPVWRMCKVEVVEPSSVLCSSKPSQLFCHLR